MLIDIHVLTTKKQAENYILELIFCDFGLLQCLKSNYLELSTSDMGKPKIRRSIKRNRGKKKSYFQEGHAAVQPNYDKFDLPNEGPEDTISRLSQAEAKDVQYVTGKSEDSDTLAFKLRPKPETEEQNGNYTYDENIIVHMQNLKALVDEVHRQHCRNASTDLHVERRHGLCIQLTVRCRSCHFVSKPVEMSARLKRKRGIGASELNERLLLTVLKSRLGIEDVNLLLSCLNIKTPSKSVLQRKLNVIADKAEEVHQEQMLDSQDYVNRILMLSGNSSGADVQTDNAFPARPQSGGEKSKQSVSAMIEHTTTRKLVLAQSVASKFCRVKNCNHMDKKCKKNYSQQESIAASEKILLRKNLDSIRKSKKVKIRSITTDASSQLAKAIREYRTEKKIQLRHYTCYVHKLRTLEKHVKAVKLKSKLPRGQNKADFMKALAKSVRTRVRLELQNAKCLKYDDNDFLLKCTVAFQNIIPCFRNIHTMCRTSSTVCQHHMAMLGRYTTKHLPYGQHIKLNRNDLQNIESAIFKTLDVQSIIGMAELFNTNHCESLHATMFNYAPKFTCWPRNFAGLCHSATHSRTVGKGVATVKLANAIGIQIRQSSPAFRQLQRIDRLNKYHSLRKQTAAYKTSRFYQRKRVENRTLYQDSLYTGQPSELSAEHNYGVN